VHDITVVGIVVGVCVCVVVGRGIMVGTVIGSDMVDSVPFVGRNVVVKGAGVEIVGIVVVTGNFVVEIIGGMIVDLLVEGRIVIVVVSGTEVVVICGVVIFGFVVPEVVVMSVEVV